MAILALDLRPGILPRRIAGDLSTQTSAFQMLPDLIPEPHRRIRLSAHYELIATKGKTLSPVANFTPEPGQARRGCLTFSIKQRGQERSKGKTSCHPDDDFVQGRYCTRI